MISIIISLLFFLFSFKPVMADTCEGTCVAPSCKAYCIFSGGEYTCSITNPGVEQACYFQNPGSCYGMGADTDAYCECTISYPVPDHCVAFSDYGGGGVCSEGCTTCSSVNGGWSNPTDNCSLKCGQSWSRTCTNPSPSCGGAGCSGASSGTCLNTDDGAPTVPTCTSLGEVNSSPVTISWTSGGLLTDYYEYNLDGGAPVNTGLNLSVSVPISVGPHTWQARATNTSCGTDVSAWSTACNVCREGGTVLGAWSSCSAVNHKRTRTCTETCGTDDCTALGAVGGIISENCIGTIKGTLFDASDLSSCPGSITDPEYASIRYGNAEFGIRGNTWNVINPPPISTDANGNYSVSAYATDTYSYDYSALIASGRATSIKFECQGATATVATQGDVVYKNTGFLRAYGGWWQTVGGSVYAGGGVKSVVPMTVVPAGNQKIILTDATGKSGMLSYGVPWTGLELGANPNARVSTPLWRIESMYEGLRYDYNFYKIRMDVFTSTAWDGGSISYSDGGLGYQIFKHTGDVTLGYSGPTGTQKVILLVNGNVAINGNVTVPVGAFLSVIASGDITFGTGVTNAEGWFVAENINVPCIDTSPADGTCDRTDVQFGGEGSFVGWTGINLKRDMFLADNLDPSELFTYRTDFMLNAPTPMKVYSKRFSPFVP